MTLQLLHSEFPYSVYEEFFFLFYQCIDRKIERTEAKFLFLNWGMLSYWPARLFSGSLRKAFVIFDCIPPVRDEEFSSYRWNIASDCGLVWLYCSNTHIVEGATFSFPVWILPVAAPAGERGGGDRWHMYLYLLYLNGYKNMNLHYTSLYLLNPLLKAYNFVDINVNWIN